MNVPPPNNAAISIWSDADATASFLKGRVALHALLRAAGVGPGDEVLVPGFTCVVVPAAIQYTGATPVFYDVDPSRMNGSISEAEERRSARTRVVIVQHTFGAISEPKAWRDFADRHGLVLLEDAAHALGATHGSWVAGGIGDGAFTSLQWSKIVTCGLGGLARFNTDALREGFDRIASEYEDPSWTQQLVLEILERAHAIVYRPRWAWTVRSAYRRLGSLGLLPASSSSSELASSEEPRGYRASFGRNRRHTLARTLSDVSRTLEHRRRIASIARAELHHHGFVVQDIEPESFSAQLRVACLVENRDDVLRLAAAERVELGDWFDAPLHPSSSPAETFGYRRGVCPVAEGLTRRLVNVPTHRWVDEQEALRIVSFIARNASRTTTRPTALQAQALDA